MGLEPLPAEIACAFNRCVLPAMTAENIAHHVLEIAQGLLGSPFQVERVRCWETPNCYADAIREG